MDNFEVRNRHYTALGGGGPWSDLGSYFCSSEMMLKKKCVECERWNLSLFELCASRRVDSNGATESFW